MRVVVVCFVSSHQQVFNCRAHACSCAFIAESNYFVADWDDGRAVNDGRRKQRVKGTVTFFCQCLAFLCKLDDLAVFLLILRQRLGAQIGCALLKCLFGFFFKFLGTILGLQFERVVHTV